MVVSDEDEAFLQEPLNPENNGSATLAELKAQKKTSK